MADRTPLSALLSQALVALTIEIDNAYETRAPHSTVEGGGAGPWLISYGMWASYLRLVPESGIVSRDLATLAGWDKSVHPAQAGMMRWGYVVVRPDPADRRPKPPESAKLVVPTPWGRAVAPIWAQRPAEIEQRWRDRFGGGLIDEVMDASTSIVEAVGTRLPAYLPQLGYELTTVAPAGPDVSPGDPGLVTSLANVLHLVAVEHECTGDLCLPVAANVLRALEGAGLRTRDLPQATGIARQALTQLVKRASTSGLVDERPDAAGGRSKVLTLTSAGITALDTYRRRADVVERTLAADDGRDVGRLRSALEAIVEGQGERLLEGTHAPAGCWRETKPPREVLPHFPMVAHRGAYPDGS